MLWFILYLMQVTGSETAAVSSQWKTPFVKDLCVWGSEGGRLWHESFYWVPTVIWIAGTSPLHSPELIHKPWKVGQDVCICVSGSPCLCVCVCVCVRERERERERLSDWVGERERRSEGRRLRARERERERERAGLKRRQECGWSNWRINFWWKKNFHLLLQTQQTKTD